MLRSRTAAPRAARPAHARRTSAPIQRQPTRQVHNPVANRQRASEVVAFKKLRKSLLNGTYEPRKSPSQLKREAFETRPDFGMPQLIGLPHAQVSPLETWVFNLQKQRVGITPLSRSTFDAPTDRVDLVHQMVRWQLNKRRAGTHVGLGRATISGTGKKPFAQKGGGRARASTLRSPIHRGGARAHPWRMQDYSFTLPRRSRRQALRTALSSRYRDGRLFVIDSASVPTFKSTEVNNILSSWNTRRALLVHGDYEQDPNLILALRNNPDFHLLPARGINVHDVLRYPIVMMSLSALQDIDTRLNPEFDRKKPIQFPGEVQQPRKNSEIKAILEKAGLVTPFDLDQQLTSTTAASQAL